MVFCPHCQSKLNKMNSQLYCSFCEIKVDVEIQTMQKLKGAVDRVDAQKSTMFLKLYHTYDLLLLLKFCRQERREAYDLMQIIKKGKEALGPAFQEGIRDSYMFYEYWTKKVRIIESLVKERLGTIPKAVTNHLLEMFFASFREADSTLKYA
ncbi:MULTISPECIES: hypothetical protein [Bacillaceae]|uniref:Uncharacterized protein n=2 Tax=Bacillaceae TaxID=186817 RepID=A0A7V7UTF9_9BACI|nr:MULTISPECIES: hypothetical protein [Bacillaceae]KAB2329471.1 hypothetical protein F7732_21335 [Bacillus mesophilum]QVY63982.1 hypothetical protein J1899_22350 [Cytobacillus gottheilii]